MLSAFKKLYYSSNLIEAVTSGDKAKVQEYLEKGADPSQKGQDGTPLTIYALQNNQLEIVLLLLQKGADPNAISNDGSTLLKLSIREPARFRLDIVELLLQNGADPNTTDDDGNTALMLFAQYFDTQSTKFAKLLLQKGADPNAKNTDGQTALIMAIHRIHHSLEITKLLVQVGADPSVKDNFDKNALDYAHLYKKPELIDILSIELEQNRCIATIRNLARVLGQVQRAIQFPKDILLQILFLANEGEDKQNRLSQNTKNDIALQFFNKPPTTKEGIKAENKKIVKYKNSAR